MVHMINSKIWASGIVWIFIIIAVIHPVSSSGSDFSELKGLTSSFEDPKMSVQDLAFYLVTHNYDAAPRDDYVELQLDGVSYRLVPNGNKPGLCDISP